MSAAPQSIISAMKTDTDANSKTVHKTYQERGYCSPTGYDRLDAALDMLRHLYNAALEQRIAAYKRQRKTLTFFDQGKDLTQARKDDGDNLAKLPVNIARGPLLRLHKAFLAFHRRLKNGDAPGFPRYKGKGRYKTIDVLDPKPNNVRRQGNKLVIKVKGLPRIELRPKRKLPDLSQIKALRITRRPAGVTVDLVYEEEMTPLPPSGAIIGIDMGVRKRLALSDGTRIERAEPLADDIKKQHQVISRKKKGSNNRRKAVKQLSRLKRKQAVKNRNACHRITTDLIQRFGTISIEALKTRNMTRSAKGTTEKPGTNVAAKSGLNKSILEQTWGLLRTQLAYKAEWAGRRLVEVNPANTSRDCSRCSARNDPGSSETYHCRACGLVKDRDWNAAINVKRAGTLALARAAPEAA